jgi:hypothetical protein
MSLAMECCRRRTEATKSTTEDERPNEEDVMRKVLGIALAMLFTLTIAAAAEEGTGRSIVSDDGTTITVSEKQLSDLAPGEQVKAMFEYGSKNAVAGPAPTAIGSEFRSTTSWGPTYGTEMDSNQAE